MRAVAILDSSLGVVSSAEPASSAPAREAEEFEALVDSEPVANKSDQKAAKRRVADEGGEVAVAIAQPIASQAIPATAGQGMVAETSDAAASGGCELEGVTGADGRAVPGPVTADVERVDNAPVPGEAALSKDGATCVSGLADEAVVEVSGASNEPVEEASDVNALSEADDEPEMEISVEVAGREEESSSPDQDADLGRDSSKQPGGATLSQDDAWRGGVTALYEAASSVTNRHGTTQLSSDQSTLARHVSQQINQAVAGKPDGTVELMLSPDELGHVKVVLKHEDGAVSVSIVAERQETLDLMRRHIDLLARDFRELGYADMSFSFSDRGREGRPALDVPGGGDADRVIEDPVLLKNISNMGSLDLKPVSGGLDLRM